MDKERNILEQTISECDINEPHYEYSEYHQTNDNYGYVLEYQDEMLKDNVYSPQQLLKKSSQICSLNLNGDDYEFEYNNNNHQRRDSKRKTQYLFGEHRIQKKLRINGIKEEHNSSTTVSDEDEYDSNQHFQSSPKIEVKMEELSLHICQEGDLEKLVNDINQECKTAASTPQSIRIPSVDEISQHLKSLKLRFKPTTRQEEFLKGYVSEENIKKMKIGIDSELLQDDETHRFEEWVEHLCTATNHKSLKEMSRRQKVRNYLQKKHSRTYEKKVHYHIRQKVAEERLRVKGRFVTWSQALQMLNEQQDTKKPWNYEDYFKIKKMLKDKFGANKQ